MFQQVPDVFEEAKKFEKVPGACWTTRKLAALSLPWACNGVETEKRELVFFPAKLTKTRSMLPSSPSRAIMALLSSNVALEMFQPVTSKLNSDHPSPNVVRLIVNSPASRF